MTPDEIKDQAIEAAAQTFADGESRPGTVVDRHYNMAEAAVDAIEHLLRAPTGYFVGYIAELDDDSEGPQLVEWSGTVCVTEAEARAALAEALAWRPGWRIYELSDITDRRVTE